MKKYSTTEEQNRLQITEEVNKYAKELEEIVKALYLRPEIGGEEYFAHDLLSSWLEDNAFELKRNLVMPTGFSASYGKEGSGPVIAFPAEYDALPDIGHGCGHNLFGAISLLAAKALQKTIDQVGGQVLVVGTPAEENFGGKIKMADAGVFADVSAALMIHPSNKNGLGGASLALNPIKFEFFGKNAHACHAHEGASALDAAVLAFTSINFQRQYLKENCYIHGIIKEGGKAANVIPAYAALEYYFRAPKMATALAMSKEAIRRAEAAALSSGCKLEHSIFECPYGETLVNEKLALLLQEEFLQLGLENIEAVNLTPAGSTDVGAVSFVCPTIHAYIKICAADVAGHSKEMAAATVSLAGFKALRDGAEALALTANRLMHNPALLEDCQLEFLARKDQALKID